MQILTLRTLHGPLPILHGSSAIKMILGSSGQKVVASLFLLKEVISRQFFFPNSSSSFNTYFTFIEWRNALIDWCRPTPKGYSSTNLIIQMG